MSFQAKTYSYSEDYPIHSKTLEDPSFQEAEYSEYPEEFDPGTEDLDVYSSEADVQAEPNGYSAPDADSLRAKLHDLEISPAGAELQQKIQELRGLLNQAQGFVSAAQKSSLLSQVQAELSALEAQIMGVSEEGGIPGEAPPASLADLEKELKDYKQELGLMKNLTEDERIERESQIDKWLTEINLAENDPEKVDVAGIQETLTEMKTETEAVNQYSTGLKGLASSFDMSEEQVKLKAEAKGIDLDNLSLPPTVEFLNFLTELSPDLKDAFKKVETAMSDRVKSIQDNAKTMNDISRANYKKDTSAACNQDITPWQNSFDLKHFQDDKSKAVASAMQELVKTLTPIFKALFPGEEVKAVEDNSPAGWEKAQGEYLVADKIQIRNITIDLINNTTGKMQCSITPDADADIQIQTIWYDGEGDGEWHPPKLQTYGDNQPGQRDNEDTTSWTTGTMG